MPGPHGAPGGGYAPAGASSGPMPGPYGAPGASYGAPYQQPAQPGAMTGPLGRLVVHTGFFPLMWLLFFVNTVITINGQRSVRPWGSSVFDLPAGDYQVSIAFNYLFGPAGPARRTVRIHPGHATRLSYSAPWLVFLDGSMRESPPYPDHQLQAPR